MKDRRIGVEDHLGRYICGSLWVEFFSLYHEDRLGTLAPVMDVIFRFQNHPFVVLGQECLIIASTFRSAETV